MRLVIVICVLTIQFSYGQDTVFLDAKWKPTVKRSATYYRVDKKEGGLWTRQDFYLQGNHIQMRGAYQSLDPEIKTGQFEHYHTNGKLKHIGSFKDNKEAGEHKWYSDSGNIEAIENYDNGKLNGVFKEYHPNGKISIESNFSNGIQTGKTTYFREDGTKHSEGNFKDGDRNGPWSFYDESGKLAGTQEYKTEYVIKEANMFIKLPNSEWGLSNKIDGQQLAQYFFKRTPIEDSEGRGIIPAIMVFVEDAPEYKQDVIQYSIVKRIPFKGRGLRFEQMLIHENKEYPLTYKNACFSKYSYTDNGMDHVLYMIHIINKENKGIQVYLDMTKSLVDEYEKEFWITIRSLREE